MRVTFTLAESEHQDLQSISLQNDVSIAWIIRKAVKEYLERHPVGQAELRLTAPKE